MGKLFRCSRFPCIWTDLNTVVPRYNAVFEAKFFHPSLWRNLSFVILVKQKRLVIFLKIIVEGSKSAKITLKTVYNFKKKQKVVSKVKIDM